MIWPDTDADILSPGCCNQAIGLKFRLLSIQLASEVFENNRNISAIDLSPIETIARRLEARIAFWLSPLIILIRGVYRASDSVWSLSAEVQLT